MSLSKLKEAKDRGVILLVGAPGAGKSTFCNQMVLKSMATERPVIMVTTEQDPSQVVKLLRKRGLVEAGVLKLVDAFTKTVGLECMPGKATTCANCSDLNSLSVAITALSNRIAKKNILFIIDSLTSPYLFNGMEVVKFIRLFLSKIASQGNSVIATIDEGCGKKEDIGAMMSVSDGVVKIEMKEDRQLIDVVKYPGLEPIKIEIPKDKDWEKKLWDFKLRKKDLMIKSTTKLLQGRAGLYLRREYENYVNLFWLNLANWSGIIWDPENFPVMIYEFNRKHGAGIRKEVELLPRYMRLLFKLFISKSFSRVKDMKKLLKMGRYLEQSGCGILKYLEDKSGTDEHYIRVYDSYECCSFKNVGAPVASIIPPMIAGLCMGFEEKDRSWNVIETKCVGLGDPYCEFKLVPAEISGLKQSLKKDPSVIERINERLMENLLGYILDGKPPAERPRLGSNIHIEMALAALAVPIALGERYQMAIRMGGVKTGKELGERLMVSGLEEDEAVKRLIEFMDYCKVGKISIGETIKISENCESLWSRAYTEKMDEPSCFFTTGFLNGFFLAVKNKYVREIKCIAVGDPYCEWEIG